MIICNVPSNADGIVSGSSGVKGEEFKFGFKTVQVESRVSASCLLLFCFLFLLLLGLFAGGSVLTSAISRLSREQNTFKITSSKLEDWPTTNCIILC